MKRALALKSGFSGEFYVRYLFKKKKPILFKFIFIMF